MTATARLRRAAVFIVFNVVTVCTVFVLIEGFASTAQVFNELRQTEGVAERQHTEFDAELGWVNRRNVFIPDMYGPSAYLRINQQRFRNDTAVLPKTPSGKLRAICSGDSFTFGYGVANDKTWCHLLAADEPRLETVNMGQGGYGLDQIYLWFRRDAADLAHQFQLLAVVSVDFDRMLLSSFLGYNKPTLDVDGTQLVVRNVPIEKPNRWRLWWLQRLPVLQHLHSVQYLRGAVQSDPPTLDERRATETRFKRIVGALLADLQRRNAAKHSRLVVIFLPTRSDYQDDRSAFWREFLAAETARLEVPFIDLVEEFRRIPPLQVADLFIQENTQYVGAAGHYSPTGNEVIEHLLMARLRPLIDAELKQQAP